MAEVWALLALMGMFFGGGRWFGRHSVEVKLRGVERVRVGRGGHYRLRRGGGRRAVGRGEVVGR